MGLGVEIIHKKIQFFQRKYYLNLLVRGLILSLAIILSYYLLIAFLEYTFWLGPVFRFILLGSFFTLVAFIVLSFLREPIRWFIAKRGLNEEQSAKIIGQNMPGIKDGLLNF